MDVRSTGMPKQCLLASDFDQTLSCQALLRRTQACAAALWLVYGALIHSMPVMTANIIVGGVALWSSFRSPVRAVAPAPAAEDRAP